VAASFRVASAHPNQDFFGIAQLGRKASNLALLHQAVIAPRLPPATLSTLVEDIDRLAAVVPGARQVRQEAMVATAAQAEALRVGYARVKAVRTAVKKSDASREVKRGYGVGQEVRSDRVRDVKSVLQQILDRAAAYPEEAASFGIVQKDVDAITAAHQAIVDANKSHDDKQVTAPLSTQERNRVGNRILAAVARIAGAGALEFAENADVLAAFAALRPPSGTHKKKKDPTPKTAQAPHKKKAAAPAAAGSAPAAVPAPAVPAPAASGPGFDPADLEPVTLIQPLKKAS
jgi:hypothetical protein